MSDSNQLTTGALARLWAMKGEEIPEPAVLQVTKLYGEHGLLLSDGRYKTYVFRLGGRNKLTIFDIIQLTRLRLATDILNPSVPSYYRSLNLRLVSTPGHSCSWAILGNPGHLLGSPEEVGFTDDGQVLDGLAMDMRDLRRNLVTKSPIGLVEKMCLEEGVFADFTILSKEDLSFKCHRVFLAAKSEVFKAMMTSEMKEKEENEHKLQESTQVVEAFVRWFYKGEVSSEVMDANFSTFLRLADYYHLDAMKAQAEDVAISGLTVENVLEMFCLADLYNAGVLKEATSIFIKEKKEDLGKQDLSHVPTNIRTELSKLLN